MCISVCVCVIERGRPVKCLLFWGLGGSQMERMKVHKTENYIFPHSAFLFLQFPRHYR